LLFERVHSLLLDRTFNEGDLSQYVDVMCGAEQFESSALALQTVRSLAATAKVDLILYF
jgi:hypothetical protein